MYLQRVFLYRLHLKNNTIIHIKYTEKMLNKNDYYQIEQKGISKEQIKKQLASFVEGFPFLTIVAPAKPDQGLFVPNSKELEQYLASWNSYLSTDAKIMKFVPASGAASRMFKDLFEYIQSDYNEPQKAEEKLFFFKLEQFAFYDALDKECVKNTGKTIKQLLSDKAYKTVVENLLLSPGLNYGALPKGLLLFHSYPDGKRTAMEEHLAEAALYASNNSNEVDIHFTVSTEHRSMFENHSNESIESLNNTDKTYHISFSEQKPSTDTIAVDANNEPFREDGEIVFRPGGHGALIENLNDLEADIIFVKNIDNVVPDSMKDDTVRYKKIIGGLLVEVQKNCFSYLERMEIATLSLDELTEIADFCKNTLNITHPNISKLNSEELQDYLYSKLNRPIRVCGMVKNTGEPGGGPFLTVNQDGTISPQILESSQIDLTIGSEKAKMNNSTHFNPVDLICAVKDFKANKFDLLKYVDQNTGFISGKTKNGKQLKALELPGLWNGAMSDWNTVFVEVPISTFNPVKTVNDLLRDQHQS